MRNFDRKCENNSSTIVLELIPIAFSLPHRSPGFSRGFLFSKNMREYRSFYKEVGGGEGEKCLYNTRLDTYGCGCQHDCSYCYAKSLLSFRGLWDPDDPAVADDDRI